MLLRKSIFLPPPPPPSEEQKAEQIAFQHLERAKQLMSKGQDYAFYEAIYHGVLDYIAFKLSIPRSELDLSRVEQELQKAQLHEQTVTDILDVLKATQRALFSRMDQQAEQSIYTKSVAAISKIELLLQEEAVSSK